MAAVENRPDNQRMLRLTPPNSDLCRLLDCCHREPPQSLITAYTCNDATCQMECLQARDRSKQQLQRVLWVACISGHFSGRTNGTTEEKRRPKCFGIWTRQRKRMPNVLFINRVPSKRTWQLNFTPRHPPLWRGTAALPLRLAA